MISPIRNITNPRNFIMASMLSAAITGGTALRAQNSVPATSDNKNLPKIVNTNRGEYLPKNAIAKARLLTVFDINGNNIIDDNEEKGLRKVLESGGMEQWDIYDDNGRRVGYIMDGSELDADPSDTYEYAALNENNQRTYYSRVNIYTGDEIFIRYVYSENGDYEERYHNKNLDGKVDAVYTGPNKDKLKKLTEVKAIYKQTYVLDEHGNKIFDEETGEPKVKEELSGYMKIITEYNYDENYNQIGAPIVTREYKIIKPVKRLDIKG